MLTTLIAGITAFDIYYANLPDTAYSYDGEARSISQFYNQKIPNVYLGGYYPLGDSTNLLWAVNTGTHTDKLSDGSLMLGIQHGYKINDKWSIMGQASITTNFNNHSPCTDNYNRKYYCGNLTAWSDIEGQLNETEYNPEIRISFNRSW